MKSKSLSWVWIGIACAIGVLLIAGLVVWIQQSQNLDQNEPDNVSLYAEPNQ